jgi:AcrR family transcriptional regulator
MKTAQGGKRAYRLGRRRTRAEETRARLLTAAERILMRRNGVAAFSLESIARRAGVSRLTVYHQFGSKVGLLEALYDDLALRARLAERIAAAFQLPDSQAVLDAIVMAFAAFWSGQRSVIRRLRSMAVLDSTFRGATDRDARRLQVMRTALLRLAAASGRSLADADECARVLAMLTSFETFDALAGPGVETAGAAAIVQRLVHGAVAAALR